MCTSKDIDYCLSLLHCYLEATNAKLGIRVQYRTAIDLTTAAICASRDNGLKKVSAQAEDLRGQKQCMNRSTYISNIYQSLPIRIAQRIRASAEAAAIIERKSLLIASQY